jgi:hypothetical protein
MIKTVKRRKGKRKIKKRCEKKTEILIAQSKADKIKNGAKLQRGQNEEF